MYNKQIPFTFASCHATPNQCAHTDACLHHYAALCRQMQPNGALTELCIHPQHYASLENDQPCSAFKSSEPVKFARGMRHLFDKVPHATYERLRREVIKSFSCRRHYFYARKGERLIEPLQQAKIAKLFTQKGFDAPQFDAYEMHPLWVA